MKYLLIILFSINFVNAEVVFSVKPGEDYKQYTEAEMKKRIHWLEKAVRQLQHKVYNLESAKKKVEKKEQPTGKWMCKITVMSNTYKGYGESRTLAEGNVIENCKKAQKGTTLFCKVPRCFKNE